MNKINAASQQQGFVLIAVLIILLMITLLGVVAIRFGLTGLQLATNTQAKSLAFQASDTALNEVQTVANDPAQLFIAEVSAGLIGYPKLVQGHEVVFCYRPTGSGAVFFDITKASEIFYNTSGTFTNGNLGSGGYCKVETSGDYTSGRNATMTQVTIMSPVDSNLASTPFSAFAQGGDVSNEAPARIRIYSTSIVPGLARAGTSTINGCLSGHVSDLDNAKINSDGAVASTETDVASCLTTNNIPFNTQVQEYVSGTTSCAIGTAGC